MCRRRRPGSSRSVRIRHVPLEAERWGSRTGRPLSAPRKSDAASVRDAARSAIEADRARLHVTRRPGVFWCFHGSRRKAVAYRPRLLCLQRLDSAHGRPVAATTVIAWRAPGTPAFGIARVQIFRTMEEDHLMARMTGAQMLLESLQREDVDTIF